MSYSTDRAKLLANQLTRFSVLNTYQLAGQVENLNFWMVEVRHSLAVLDGYGVRFVRLEAAQTQYLETHGVEKVVEVDGVRRPNVVPVRRVPDRELQKARRSLVDAVSRCFARCQDEGLICKSQAASLPQELGIKSDSPV